jgi:hypothetical protein
VGVYQSTLSPRLQVPVLSVAILGNYRSRPDVNLVARLVFCQLD